jgi:hypothetical protein
VKKCNACNEQLNDDAIFCGNCGEKQPERETVIEPQELVTKNKVTLTEKNTKSEEIDPFLNGTWISQEIDVTIRLNNGNLELLVDGSIVMKGTYYTFDKDKISMTQSHLNGGFSQSVSLLPFVLESRYYSKNELKILCETYLRNEDKNLNEGEIEELFDEQSDFWNLFFTKVGCYSINNNTLNIDFGDDGYLKYDRQN